MIVTRNTFGIKGIKINKGAFAYFQRKTLLLPISFIKNFFDLFCNKMEFVRIDQTPLV